MIFKNKELFMQVCNIVWHDRDYWYDTRMHAKNMYYHLLNCDKNENWYAYYHNRTYSQLDREFKRIYKNLIRSLNEFNRFKVS